MDSLASRLGIHMSMNRSLGGYYGRSNVVIGERSLDLTLYKPSMLVVFSLWLVLMIL